MYHILWANSVFHKHPYKMNNHVSDPCPPPFEYSFQALWCVNYDYHHSRSWVETRDLCVSEGGRMMTFESQRKLDRIVDWINTSGLN